MAENEVTMHTLTDDKTVQYISKRIREFNSDKLGLPSNQKSPIQLLLKDSRGETIGGIIANQWWTTLEIYSLWVDEHYRKKGYGKQLIQEVEGRAKAKGCKQVILNTLDFQAPGFYKKLDYELCAECKDYLEGHNLYYFRKQL
jgi:ribosomal protein S18 acetylase RimI-like enzyme